LGIENKEYSKLIFEKILLDLSDLDFEKEEKVDLEFLESLIREEKIDLESLTVIIILGLKAL
jgi:hypothetical protein